jgi:hypothetical protein
MVAAAPAEVPLEEPSAIEFVAPVPSMGEAPRDDALVAAAPAEVPLHASLEAGTAGDASVSMTEHLQQLLRAAEEREKQDQVDTTTPAPRRRGRPSKRGRQFNFNRRKEQGPSGD